VARQDIKLLANTQLPKVTVHQTTQDNSLFQHSTVHIADNSHLLDDNDQPLLPDLRIHFYFLLDCAEDFREGPLYRTLLTAIHLLPETGLGGDRSTGCGLFEGVDTDDFEMNISAKNYASLSLVAPDSATELAKTEFYHTVLRGGRATRTEPQPLRMVRMMREGALLSPSVKGCLVDIAPTGSTQPFLRNGKAFVVPVAT
jgi:CRISPR-associated protein Csm4